MHAPTVDEQKNYWKYWQRTRTDSRYARERADEVFSVARALKLNRPRILDLGCGTGWFTERLATLGPATGLDLNDEAMAKARQRRPDITFIGGSIYHNELKTGCYDLIVSLQVIAHVDDQPEFMRLITDLAAPGGYLIISTSNRFVMERLGDDDAGSHASLGHIEKWLSKRELRELAAKPLQVIKVWTLSPAGNAGILRVANSSKLNALLGLGLEPETLRRVKERLGLGYTLLLLAKKP